MPGKPMPPAPGPELTWKDRSEATGSVEPLVNLADEGDAPNDSRAWRTSAVESGSVDPGVRDELGP
jgi:hypothetical protein